MGRRRLYKILKELTIKSSKLIKTPNVILVIKLEFRRAPGTNGYWDAIETITLQPLKLFFLFLYQ